MKRKKYQQRERRFNYDKAKDDIYWLALAIPDAVCPLWRQVILCKSPPREILQTLQRFAAPSHSEEIRGARDRFWEVVTRRDIQNWTTWATDFNLAHENCIELKVPDITEEIAIREFLGTIRREHQSGWSNRKRPNPTDKGGGR